MLILFYRLCEIMMKLTEWLRLLQVLFFRTQSKLANTNTKSINPNAQSVQRVKRLSFIIILWYIGAFTFIYVSLNMQLFNYCLFNWPLHPSLITKTLPRKQDKEQYNGRIVVISIKQECRHYFMLWLTVQVTKLRLCFITWIL